MSRTGASFVSELRGRLGRKPPSYWICTSCWQSERVIGHIYRPSENAPLLAVAARVPRKGDMRAPARKKE
eukprot:6377427-Pyramimonas_sp.AAC.1